MDIGVFIPIGRNGWIVSTTSPQYNPSFELNKQTTLNAERYGFDFALSMIKLRGFGGQDRVLGPQPRVLHPDGGPRRRDLAHQALRHGADAGHSAGDRRAHGARPSIRSPTAGSASTSSPAGSRPEYAQMGLWPGDEYFARRYDFARRIREGAAGAVDDRRLATSRASSSRWRTAGSAPGRRRRSS